MDITITNVRGYTTVKIGGEEAHFRQKRKDFLKEDFNIVLQSIHQKNNIVNEITHDKATLTPKKEIGVCKWQQGSGKTIEKSGDYYER